MHGNARLTTLDIVAIKRLLWDGDTQTDIAKRYGVSDNHISRISRGIAYPDIEWPNGSTNALPQDRRRPGGRPRTREYTNIPSPDPEGMVKEIEKAARRISIAQDISNEENLLFNITGGLRGNSRKEKT